MGVNGRAANNAAYTGPEPSLLYRSMVCTTPALSGGSCTAAPQTPTHSACHQQSSDSRPGSVGQLRDLPDGAAVLLVLLSGEGDQFGEQLLGGLAGSGTAELGERVETRP